MLHSVSIKAHVQNFRDHYLRMSACRHHLLVPVLDYGFDSESKTYFYTMPWIEHIALQDHQWNLKDLVILAVQISQTFVYIHRMGFHNSSLCPSHILWLEKPDDSGGHVRLIDYGDTFSSESFWRDDSEIGGESSAIAEDLRDNKPPDVHILYHIVSDLVEKTRQMISDDSTGRNEARGLRQLRELMHDVLFEDDRTNVDRSWTMVMRLLTALDDHAYAQSPSRRIYFTEGPFLGREETASILTRWLDENSGPMLVLSGLKGMGRRRMLRYWLSRRRVERTTVIELDTRNLPVFLECLEGSDPDPEKENLVRWLSSQSSPLIVIHPQNQEEFNQIEWDRLFKLIQRKSWRLIVSVDERMLAELIDRSLLDWQFATRYWLTPISYNDSCRLIVSLLGSDQLSRKLLHENYKLARGNPGLIIQAVNFWISEDLLVRENGQWRLTLQETTPLPVPPEVQQTFRERLDNLPEPAMNFLKKFTLLDKSFGLDELVTLFENHDLKNIMELLLRRDILNIDERSETGMGYCFSHSIIRMTILENMTEVESMSGHREIAGRMEALNWPGEDIAYHWLYAGESEKGIRRGLEVAWELRYKGDFLRAEEWIDRLLRNSEGLSAELRGQVMYLFSEISLLRHRHQDVIDGARAGLELLARTPENSETRSFLYQHLGQVHMRESRFEEASLAVKAGLEELKDAKTETSVTLRILAGAIARHQGRYRVAWSELNAAKKESVFITNPGSSFSAHATILNLHSTLAIDKGDIDTARRLLDEALTISDDRKFSFYRALLRNKRAELEITLGNYSTAETYLAESMRICQTAGILSESAVAWQFNGSIAAQKGHFEDAESYYRRSLEIAQQLNRKLEILRPKRLLARLYRITGRFSEARSILLDLSKSYDQAARGPGGCSILIETGMLDIEQAQYSAANRRFQLACQWMEAMQGHRDEAWARYGLALTAWRLNHLGRTRKYLLKARHLAESTQNKVLLAWIWLLEARLRRLDRDRTGFLDALIKAENHFQVCESKPGLIAIAELRLRDTIDHDLSDEVWDEAVRLWEESRLVGAWRQIIDVALTLTRLGVRRGSYQQIAGVLDASIGMARQRGCKEELWRLLRIRAQSQEDQGFKSIAKESLKSALATASEVIKDIHSPLLKKTYRARYDFQALKIRMDQIDRDTRSGGNEFDGLPSLKGEEESRERMFAFNSEHYRLLRNTVRRFRHHFDNRDLVEDLSNVMLKMTGADRLVIFLRSPGEDLFELAGSKRVGMAPELDGKLLRSSPLFEKVVTQKHHLFSANIQADPHYNSLAIGRHIGQRAVLVTPMRAARDVVGVIYTDVKTGGIDVMIGNVQLVQELADEAALSLEIAGLYRDLDETFMSMVRALGTAVDAKDPHTHGHASRVAEYALRIGREMGLRAEELRDLEIGAYLHDLGKIGIAGVILKSRDKLTESEMESIRHHPEIGTRILTPVRKLARVAQAIRQHHERYDGKGYPDQLKGEEIVLIARIIAVADALDAMTTKRPYQEAMTPDHAVNIIVSNAGTQFDPLVTAALKKLYSRGEIKLL